MGYDIHITREACWLDDENPITLDEVREILPVEPHQFRIDETGEVLIATPQGNAMIADYGPFLEYTDEEGKKTILVFEEGECPFFTYRDCRQLLAMRDLAETLGATLQGDECEVYDRQEIEILMES